MTPADRPRLPIGVSDFRELRGAGMLYFGGQVIYNPWSVLNFLASEDKVLRPYWVQTSSEDLLRRVVFSHGLGQDGELEILLAGGEIDERIDDGVALRDLDTSPEAVWSFLLFTGYLKATTVRMEGAETRATLAIPNKEVEYVYQKGRSAKGRPEKGRSAKGRPQKARSEEVEPPREVSGRSLEGNPRSA